MDSVILAMGQQLNTVDVFGITKSQSANIYWHTPENCGNKHCNEQFIAWQFVAVEEHIIDIVKCKQMNSIHHGYTWQLQKKKKNSASKLYRPSDRRLSAKLVPIFADRGSHVVSVTDSYGHILAFLDRSRYFFFQVAPQLYSRDWVDPVPDPLLLRKSVSAGNLTRASVSVATSSH
jgi:hypothetical protein